MKKFYKHKLENLILVQKVITIHYLELGMNFRYEGESHDFWEIVYADKGDVICNADGNVTTLKQGKMLFHKPNEYHSLSANGITAPNVFIITFECKSPAMEFFEGKCFTLPKPLRQYVQSILSEARQTFELRQDPFITKMQLQNNPLLGGQQMIRTNLEQLLISLLRQENEKNPALAFYAQGEFENEIVNQIISLLSDNLHANLSISDICQSLKYGKTYLSTLFKKQTDHTIMQYYQKLKIDEAKRLLRQYPTIALKTLADTLAFSSLSYFCKAFKSQLHMTPTQYLSSISPL